MYTKNNKPKKSTKTEHVEFTLTMAQYLKKLFYSKRSVLSINTKSIMINFIGLLYYPPFQVLVVFITCIFQKMLVSTSNMSPRPAILTESNTLCTALESKMIKKVTLLGSSYLFIHRPFQL